VQPGLAVDRPQPVRRQHRGEEHVRRGDVAGDDDAGPPVHEAAEVVGQLGLLDDAHARMLPEVAVGGARPGSCAAPP
jgi:hypothetical protein